MTRIGLNDRIMGRLVSRAVTLLWGLAVTACVYDPDAQCGDDLKVYGDGVRCVCPNGSIWTATGCQKCGKNERSTATTCECKEGFVRNASGACARPPEEPEETEAPEGADAAAGTDSTEPDETMTATCTEAADCEPPSACHVGSGTCMMPPTGLKTPCTSAADCEGFEAGYCNVGFSNVCEVNMCNVATNDCFPGFHCCDVTAFGIPDPLCIEEMYPCP